jgi:hypothetical protein
MGGRSSRYYRPAPVYGSTGINPYMGSGFGMGGVGMSPYMGSGFGMGGLGMNPTMGVGMGVPLTNDLGAYGMSPFGQSQVSPFTQSLGSTFPQSSFPLNSYQVPFNSLSQYGGRFASANLPVVRRYGGMYQQYACPPPPPCPPYPPNPASESDYVCYCIPLRICVPKPPPDQIPTPYPCPVYALKYTTLFI